MTSLDHVTITAADFAASLAFYDAVLGALGLLRLDELVDEEEEDSAVEAVAWGTADGTRLLWLMAGEPGTSGLHVRLRTESPVEVETFYASGVSNGGTSRDAPRRWTIYRCGEFHASVADPAGNVVEAVSPE